MAKQVCIYALLPGIPHLLFTITLSHLSFSLLWKGKEGLAVGKTQGTGGGRVFLPPPAAPRAFTGPGQMHGPIRRRSKSLERVFLFTEAFDVWARCCRLCSELSPTLAGSPRGYHRSGFHGDGAI